MGRSVTCFVCLLALTAFATLAPAADYTVEPLPEGPPTDEISADVAAQLSPAGIKVNRGSRTLCQIWLCKEIVVKSLKPSADLIYPFQPGQLIGVVKFARKAADFRDQDVSKGVYTMRFAMQPVDGNHVGTSPTRDFAALLAAETDTSAGLLDYKKLAAASAEVAGSSHPCLFSLQRVMAEAKSPSIRNDEAHDWWIVRLSPKVRAGDEVQQISMEMVIVGQASE